jgi:hypothetical protein
VSPLQQYVFYSSFFFCYLTDCCILLDYVYGLVGLASRTTTTILAPNHKNGRVRDGSRRPQNGGRSDGRAGQVDNDGA